MPRRRRSKSLAAQAVNLGFAVPQVMAHRLTRIALAGGSPSKRDRTEFQRMGMEKILAANEAWNAMALQTLLENQKLALSFMQSVWFPWVRRPSASTQLSNAALEVLGKGVAPIRRRAVANAARLRRTKLR